MERFVCCLCGGGVTMQRYSTVVGLQRARGIYQVEIFELATPVPVVVVAMVEMARVSRWTAVLHICGRRCVPHA